MERMGWNIAILASGKRLGYRTVRRIGFRLRAAVHTRGNYYSSSIQLNAPDAFPSLKENCAQSEVERVRCLSHLNSVVLMSRTSPCKTLFEKAALTTQRSSR